MLISTNSGLYSARPGKPRWSMCEAMDFFAAAGFEAVDVNFCAVIYSDPLGHEPILDGDWETNLDRLKECIAANRLMVSHTHLPFRYDRAVDTPYYLDPMMKRAIDASAHLGAPYAVCHPERGNTPEKETLIEETIAVFAPLCEYSASKGVTLAMENMFSTTPEQLMEITDRLGCAVCWDVGHANIGGHAQDHAFRLLGNRVKVLHLHDNYGARDNHNPPYFGNIRWTALIDLLREIGYEGTFNYEVAASALPEELRWEHARYMVKAAKLMLGRPDAGAHS